MKSLKNLHLSFEDHGIFIPSHEEWEDSDLTNICNLDIWYCFDIKSYEGLCKLQAYELIHPDRENFKRCVAREKWLEIQSAKNNNRVLFYNDELNVFTDYNFKVVDISNKRILFRTDAHSVIKRLNSINNAGGISVTSKEDVIKATNWLDYYSPKRKISKLTLLEYKKTSENNWKGYEGLIFFKTVGKHMHEVAPSLSHASMAMMLDNDSSFIVSENVDIKSDLLGNHEYRVFVIDGNIISISRYEDYVKHDIPNEIRDFAEKLVSETTFINSYVVDLMIYDNDKIDVVEYNPINASGRYVQNTI